MGFTGNYLVSLLLYVSIVNEIRLPQVTCQDEEGSQCIPKRTFMTLLRLPEVSSNLAAYSRTARVIQDVKNRNDMAHLKALTEEGDDTEICIPGGIYLELFRDPAMRGHLAAIGRTQKLPEFPGRPFEENEEVEDRDLFAEYPKRSIATLAKNDDLPVSIQSRDENQDDEEKRSITSEHMSMVLRRLLNEESRRSTPGILREYLLPSGELDLESLAREFRVEKRNVGSLARDFALPTGRRNVASLARDYGLPSGKRNIGTLARDRMLPSAGKKNVASLARMYMLPQSGKRNIASLARDDGLSYRKRYLGSLARTSSFPLRDEQKRSVASLTTNSDWPAFSKRGVSAPGSVILRALSRYGRSLSDNYVAENTPLDLQELTNQDQNEDKKTEENSFRGFMAEDDFGKIEVKNRSNRRIDENEKRSKRRIDFSDKYPSPAMQNADVIDYEEIMEALNRQYPNNEKRFMGSSTEMQSDVSQFSYPETFQANKRHIGALARLGWLPSFRAARFSRSPRYLIGRENPADGTSTDYTANSSTWPLRQTYSPQTRYIQALHGDCRHGFKRFMILPSADNFHRQKVYTSLRSM